MKSKLRRLLDQKRKCGNRTIDIADIVQSYIADGKYNAVVNVIVDSGTTYHLAKEKGNFKKISNKTVSIRGVNGLSKGYWGVLRPSQLGYNIPAIYFPEMPVNMLISTQGLKRDGWETYFTLEGDMLTNRKSGTMLPLVNGQSNNLPTLNLHFSDEYSDDDEECAYICTPCEEYLPKSQKMSSYHSE